MSRHLRENLNFLTTAIGSLPHKNQQEAVGLIFDTIGDAPLCPQLSKLSPNEDMMMQFTEHFPGIRNDNGRIYADLESDEYFSELEELFMDFEDVMASEKLNENILQKYAVSTKHYSSLPEFLRKLEEKQPKFVKGQIVGAFTFGTSTFDKEKRCVFYDETYREVISKTLILKALWQVNEYFKVSPKSQPIIFLDEPTMSQLGTSAYLTVTKEEVQLCINQIADALHKYGIIVGMHCCGKTDWQILLDTQLDLINFDAYSYCENFSLYAPSLKKFLDKDGIIAWGIVPTLDENAVENATAENLISIYNNGKNLLVSKGIDENKILKSTILTPSCGASGLSIKNATKTMNLLKEVSTSLRQMYFERLK